MDVLREIAKKLKVEEDKVFVLYVKGVRGRAVSEGFTLIFMNGVEVTQIEPKYRRKLEGLTLNVKYNEG